MGILGVRPGIKKLEFCILLPNNTNHRMKSKILLLILSLASIQAMSQDQFPAFIKEAQDYYAQKNYQAAQLSLHDAINELNTLMAVQIADALPKDINGLQAVQQSSNAAGMGMMGGGMSIEKRYQHPSKKENSADLTILANSPMLQAMSMYLNNPAMMGSGYKSVRVGSQRAILKSEMEDFYDDNGTSKQIRSTELQIPLTSTLITLNMKGFASEQEELAFANKLGIDKLKAALGE